MGVLSYLRRTNYIIRNVELLLIYVRIVRDRHTNQVLRRVCPSCVTAMSSINRLDWPRALPCPGQGASERYPAEECFMLQD
jgi:hypothetical protein